MAEPIYDVEGFWELLERRVAATPDHPMLYDASDRVVTFGEFKARAERVAAAFSAMGIRENSVVTWQLPTRIETLVASFALSRLGAVQNPIIQIYREREVGFALKQMQPELVLIPGVWRNFDYGKMIENLSIDLEKPPTVLVAYDALPEGDPSTLPPAPSTKGEPIRWVYYTSGTTSDPKGAQHTDQTLLAGGIGLALKLDMQPSDVGSIAFPYAHIGGPNYVVMMLTHGMPAVLLEAFVPAEAIEIYKRHNVTMAGGSTAFYISFLNEQRKQPGDKIIPTLRILSGGGAPKPPELFTEVRDEIGAMLCHGYGMTEVPMIAQGGPRDTAEQLMYTEGGPVKDCQIDILREDGTPARPNEVGEVRLSGPMLFKGYRDHQLNSEAFDDRGRLRTGDLGLLREDGYITLTGRLKDVIIRKGENISAKEIEDVLYTHPKVGDCAVIGIKDRERGERVCAVVETAPGQNDLTFAEMVEWCKQAGLMIQKIPEQLEVMTLPRNPTFKILKYKLREQLT